MDIGKIQKERDRIILQGVRHFQPEHIFECGQCFRFEKVGAGYDIVAYGKKLHVEKQQDTVSLSPCKEEDFERIWRRYFDLDRDYEQICRRLSGDRLLQTGMQYGEGVRILRQEPFETCISFIISANNNIGRIKGIIARICQTFGSRIAGTQAYAFPTPEQLSCATAADYFRLGCGYRSKYLEQTVRMIREGFSLESLRKMDYDRAKKELLKLPGVGPKVADCILLFSLDFGCSFPVDVWMERIMEQYLGKGATKKEIESFAANSYGADAGIAQQYLFFYARGIGLGRKNR